MPGPATPGKRGAVELLRVSQSLGDADHPPVAVQVTLHGGGVSPSAACCAQVVVRLEMCGAKLSKRLFTISG